ncbi:MAG: metalloregulator ArsR/SmtB family transcription factor [Elusimicrobia bacterium]|nr:metalloregulator ArsR/SmtB family transcription factor [Elusimicrobiota bacterium]
MKHHGVFKALADINRLRIVAVLLQSKGELCICEIMDTLHIAHYNVSRQVKVLKLAGLVSERREGRFVFFALKKAGDEFTKNLYKTLMAVDDEIFSRDQRFLNKRLLLRMNGKCVVGMQK